MSCNTKELKSVVLEEFIRRCQSMELQLMSTEVFKRVNTTSNTKRLTRLATLTNAPSP